MMVAVICLILCCAVLGVAVAVLAHAMCEMRRSLTTALQSAIDSNERLVDAIVTPESNQIDRVEAESGRTRETRRASAQTRGILEMMGRNGRPRDDMRMDVEVPLASHGAGPD